MPFAFRALLGPGWWPVRTAQLERAVAGRVVLVTGASSGIGAATARLLAGAGANVLLVARRVDVLDQLQAEIRSEGGTVHVHPCDLADLDAVDRLVADVLDQHRRVDVVISNAGKSIRRSLAATGSRFSDVTRSNDVNFLGPVRLLSQLLPSMRAAGSGHVVNVSAVSVDVPGANWAVYTATKSAFEAWLRCVAPEVRVDGIATSSIHFPLVHTPMSAPTYARAPGLSAASAAAAVARALVTRRRLVCPWWVRLAGPVLAVAQGPFDRVSALVARRSAPARSWPVQHEDAGRASEHLR